MLSKYRVLSCGQDRLARVWQLQGTNLQKLGDLKHNTQVVNAIEIDANKDLVATVTTQGYVHIWDLASSKGWHQHQRLMKFDSERLINANAMESYDYL
jgi:WD40 repeat protein